jgi:hypothetical protein
MCWDCGPGSNGCLSRCEDDLNSPCQDEFGECPCDIPDCNSPTPRNLNDDGVLGTNAQLTKEISIVPDPIEIVQADVNFQIINFTTNEKLKTIDPGEGPYSAFGGYSWYSSSGLLDSDRLGKPNYENAGSTTKIIKGSLTATVSSDGYIRDSGIISFVSGSNIKLDTNEANNIIRISVDDLYLTEMADIDDNIQPVNGSHLQHSGSAVTGGWKISPSDYPVGPQGPVIDELEDFGPDDVRIAYNENGTVGGTSDFEFVSAVPNRIGITGPVIFNDGITMSSSGGMLGNDMIEPTLKNNTESLKDYEEFYIGFFGFEDGNTQRISATGAAIPPNCSLYIYDAPPSGQAGLMTVYIENGAGFTFDECLFCNGCAAVGNTETILWAGGTAPTLSTGLDVLSFLTVDGGSTYYGFVGGMNFS